MAKTNEFTLAEAAAKLTGAQTGSCCVSAEFPADAAPGMVYVSYQLDRTAYAPEKALANGTLFTVLDKPFCGRMLGV